ncbi:LCP family protein required for cell wall assembly [Streptomyces sp. V3I8]|jgi:LCP family protein required for cell wall assembly|uniref:LCP family protein n=1 Tax=Streptomyces sp. V3I8 TaxID=3042279 RepID=UPI0027806D56|nr:LCP family protein [Streptomyces sp. V3I8]MDQ1036136.1 LCP family protein required for cell wall assembly [Streptomyces sp. V3I8]
MSAESTSEPESTPEAGTPGPRGPRSGRRKALLVTAWSAAGVLALGGTGLGYMYVNLNDNIKSVDIDQALGTDRPLDVDNGSQDILVLGSDTRSGGNKKLGGGADDGSARSDTAMIVHVYEGHKKAAVVSIPRDTLVPRPECTDSEGVTHDASSFAMFNSAYTTGGAACAVKTVESMTGIRMDHYVEVDFSGFRKLIDDLGGVEVTTTKDIEDKESHLDLEAGTHRLTGKQALGLVRTRHGVGDGSDLGRIQLQQAFIKALAEQVEQIGLLSSPKKLYDLADTATETVTTDSDLASVKELASFANGLKGIGSSRMNMVTMPVRYDPADGNRVLMEKDKAEAVWNALKDDRPIPGSATKDTATGDAKGVVTS